MAIVNNKSFRLWFSSTDAEESSPLGVPAPNNAFKWRWKLGDWCPPQILETRPNRRWYLYPRRISLVLDTAAWGFLGTSQLSFYSPTLASQTSGNSWSSGQGAAGGATFSAGNGRIIPKEWGNVMLFQGMTDSSVGTIENQQDLDAVGIQIKNPSMLAGGNDFELTMAVMPGLQADIAAFIVEGIEMNMELDLICQEWPDWLDAPRPSIGMNQQQFTYSGNAPSIANINPQPAPPGHPTQNFPNA